MSTVTIEVAFNEQFTGATKGDARVRAIPGWVTVLPPVITVILAILTQNVLVSLFCGVWSAAFFIRALPYTSPSQCCSVADIINDKLLGFCRHLWHSLLDYLAAVTCPVRVRHS